MTVNKKTRPRGFFLYLNTRNPQSPGNMNDLEKIKVILSQRGYKMVYEHITDYYTLALYRQNARKVILYTYNESQRFDIFYQSRILEFDDLVKEVERFETHEVDPNRGGFYY